MNRPSLDSKDRLFILALVVQLAASVILGVAIVRAVDRSGKTQEVRVVSGGQAGAPTVGIAGGTGPSGVTPTGAAVASAPKANTTVKDTGSVGVSKGEIKLGGLFTLSGPGDATVGVHAAQAYFNQVNAAGGVRGRKIRYVIRDDKFDPSVGYTETKDLVENEKIFAAVSWLAPNSENQQTITYLERKGIPFVGNFGQPPEYKSPISYSFTLNYTVSPRLTVRYLANTLGKKRIALIWIGLTDEINRIVISSAKAEAKRWGAQIVYQEDADVAKAVYDDTVVNARAAGANGIVTIMDAFSQSRYWQSFARSDWRPDQVGYPFAMDPQPTHAIPSGYRNVYGMQEMELPGNNTPAVREYLDAMRKYYPRDLNKLSWGSELAWLGAKMFVSAVDLAGPNPTRGAVLNALNAMTKFDSGLAPPYTIRPGPHDFVKCAKAAKISASRTWVQSSDWLCM